VSTTPLPGAPGDAVVRTVLGNGLTVLVRRDVAAPVVAIVTHVKAGYFDEPDAFAGISHVLEHMYFKGTPTRRPGEIARHTKAAGGYLNAGTIYDRTLYYTVLPAASFATGLAVQADAYAHSLIDEDELRREIEVIIEEERRKRDAPAAVATESCHALLFDTHRMRRWRIGTPDVLRTFTRDDVVRFYRKYYAPSNTVLSVVGDIDPEYVLREVERQYGDLPAGAFVRDRGPAEPDRVGFRWREETRDVEQAHVALGWRTVSVDHPDTPALDIAGAVLSAGRSSRLYREVRERSLASVVDAYHYAPTDVGVFIVGIQSPTERFADATCAAWAQVHALAEAPPAESELRRVRAGIESRWWRRLESMDGQATYLASWEALGGWERGAAFLKALLQVTADAVHRVAGTYLTLDRSALVTLRPVDAPAFAADLHSARETLASVRPSQRAAIGPSRVESPALVGLGVEPEQVVNEVAVFRTQGGVPILVRRKRGAPIAYAQITFRGGARDETEMNAGRTTLLARTALQGTAHRDGRQLAEDVESVGAAIGRASDVEVFGWSVSAPTAQLHAALGVLAEVVEFPALPSDALQTERTIALAGLAQIRDDMSRQPARLALRAAFPDHPYGRTALGTEAGLQRCTPGDLRAWHAARVRAGEGVISIVADAPTDEIAAAVRGAFCTIEHREREVPGAPTWPASTREVVEERDKAQSALALLFPAPCRDDPRRYAARLLTTIASGLGGRFFDALRDRESLAYTVQASANALVSAGWFQSYIACAPAKEQQAREGLLREWRRLVDAPVSSDELDRAKAYSLGALAIRQQHAASILADITDAWLFGTLDELEEERARLAAARVHDLWHVAQDYVRPESAIWGIVRGQA
jgi:zinc protease